MIIATPAVQLAQGQQTFFGDNAAPRKKNPGIGKFPVQQIQTGIQLASSLDIQHKTVNLLVSGEHHGIQIVTGYEIVPFEIGMAADVAPQQGVRIQAKEPLVRTGPEQQQLGPGCAGKQRQERGLDNVLHHNSPDAVQPLQFAGIRGRPIHQQGNGNVPHVLAHAGTTGLGQINVSRPDRDDHAINPPAKIPGHRRGGWQALNTGVKETGRNDWG